MKIIHTSDIHLDSKMETLLTTQQASIRKEELREQVREMFAYAKENGVSAILICGDLFDEKTVSKKTQDFFKGLLEKYIEIDVFYVKGNHDGLFFFEHMPKNFHSFGDSFQSYDIGNVVITGIDLNDGNRLMMSQALRLVGDRLNIVMLHGNAVGYLPQKDDDFNIGDLKNHHIDYLALGHLHSYSKTNLDNRGVYCYSGVLEPRGFDEIGDKGFVLLEIDKYINTTFVPFAKRRFHKVSINVEGIMNYLDLEKVVSEGLNIPCDDIAKVVLTGVKDANLAINITLLEAHLKKVIWAGKVIDETELALNTKLLQKELSLRGEFYRSVISSDLSQADKEAVIKLGMKALNGEELG